MVWLLSTGGKNVPTYLKLLQELTVIVYLPEEEYLLNIFCEKNPKNQTVFHFKNMSSSYKWSSCQECDYSEENFHWKNKSILISLYF